MWWTLTIQDAKLAENRWNSFELRPWRVQTWKTIAARASYDGFGLGRVGQGGFFLGSSRSSLHGRNVEWLSTVGCSKCRVLYDMILADRCFVFFPLLDAFRTFREYGTLETTWQLDAVVGCRQWFIKYMTKCCFIDFFDFSIRLRTRWSQLSFLHFFWTLWWI